MVVHENLQMMMVLSQSLQGKGSALAVSFRLFLRGIIWGVFV